MSKVPGQSRYDVSVAGFSTQKYDEFSPVMYKGGIVFCTNREHEFLITHQDSKRRGLFNIFKVGYTEQGEFTSPEIFSRNLVTPFNDGPLSFSPDGNMAVFSRNIDAAAHARNVVDRSNHLGLFFAEFIEGEWKNTTGFIYNNLEYTITTPCFSPDGMYLYFGSDMPGGYGGTDIYRSRLENGAWSNPENLGNQVNTPGNEVYPFLNSNNQLFFSSDGHQGLGKKDLFITSETRSGWTDPVHLEAPVNSSGDDFGFYTDEDFKEGYFSSNRGRNDDIYHFFTRVPQLSNCDTVLENYFCFEFWDEKSIEIDTVHVSYEWEFSDGAIVEGSRIDHCFPGAGKYWAIFRIIDNTTDKTFSMQDTMKFELEDHIQPFITVSELLTVNTDITFSGLDSNLPGYSIEEYIWDFGDGGFVTGPEVTHRYENKGSYFVKLGLRVYSDDSAGKEMKCVIKQILIADNATINN